VLHWVVVIVGDAASLAIVTVVENLDVFWFEFARSFLIP